MALLEESFDNSVKVIIVGNGTVGKSSLITRFSDGKYTSDYKKTLAVDFIEKTRQIKKNDGGDETLTFFLWDTAGQEEYNSITRAYYRGASAAVIVFSTTDRASFHAVHHWHRKITEECGDVICVLVQNKIDLLDQAAVTPAEVAELRKQLNVELFRTSVKDNINIEAVFDYIGREFLEPSQSHSEQEKNTDEERSSSSEARDAAPSGKSKNCIHHHLKLQHEGKRAEERHVSRLRRVFRSCVSE